MCVVVEALELSRIREYWPVVVASLVGNKAACAGKARRLGALRASKPGSSDRPPHHSSPLALQPPQHTTMSIQPLITFKAGQCHVSVCITRIICVQHADRPQGSAPSQKVKPQQTPGYVYLYQGDDGL